jgi:ketosteroid isomerase-like protein
MCSRLGWSVPAALLLAATIAAGCGGGGNDAGKTSDEEAVRATAAEFVQAANARDWKRVCTLFTPDALAQAEALGKSCEETFAQRNRPNERITAFSVESITVDGDRATAVLKGVNSVEGATQQTQDFQKVDGEWKMGLAPTSSP